MPAPCLERAFFCMPFTCYAFLWPAQAAGFYYFRKNQSLAGINNERPAGNDYFPALTGIRAVAAWMVFIHHFNFFSVRVAGRPLNLFFSEMHIGVTIFFVLSGLLITLRYYDRGIESGRAFYHYLVKRFARIFPVFFLILSFNFVWLLCSGFYTNSFAGGWKYFVAAATLARGFFADPFGSKAFALLPQSWSLTVEECFYLLCPLIFILLRKNKRAIFLIPAALILFGITLTGIFTRFPFHGFFGSYRFLFNFTFFGRCIEFFTGIAVALAFRRYRPQQKSGLLFSAAGTFLITTCLCGLAIFHTDSHYGDYYAGGIIINNLLLPAGAISLLFWGLLTERNWLVRCLSSRAMLLFGRSSYIFYLVHLGVQATLLHNLMPGMPLVYFLTLSLLSVLLYIGFEKPVNIFLRRKLLRTPVREKDDASRPAQ